MLPVNNGVKLHHKKGSVASVFMVCLSVYDSVSLTLKLKKLKGLT